jgi:hypothetical protein
MERPPAVAASPGHARALQPLIGIRLSGWHAMLLFVVLTAALTWPQARHPLSVPDHSDPYFSMWRLAWIAHQLPRDPWHFFDANILYPARHTLAYSDAVLLQGLSAAPFIWLGVPVVLVYNLQILATFVLSGVGMFLLVRALTNVPAALISGIIFAFAPYRFDHYLHLELLSAQWMPFTLWMLHRTLLSGRLTDGLWTGTFGALQGLSSVYLTVFFATILVVLAPLLLLGGPPAVRRRALVALAAGAVLALTIVALYMLPYRAARAVVGERDAGEQALYSAGPKHYIAAMPESILYGRLTGSIGLHEKRLFPGFAAMLLVAIGLWPPLDRHRVAYAVALAVAVDISFGHRGLIGGLLQTHVGVYRGLRVVARIGAVVLMFVAILSAFGVARVLTRIRRPSLAGTAVLSIGLVVVAEYLMRPMTLEPVQTNAGEVYRWLNAQPPGVVAELPMPAAWKKPLEIGFHESRFSYNSTYHWRPIVNGYSGFWPLSYIHLIGAVQEFPSDAAVTALRERGVEYLILHERFYGPERYRAVTRVLDARDDVTVHGPFAEGAFEARAYRLRPVQRARNAGRDLRLPFSGGGR